MNRNQKLFCCLVLCSSIGCVKTGSSGAAKEDKSIIGKKTQDIGEFDPSAGAVVSDSTIDEKRLATPIVGPMAAYGPLMEQISKMGVQRALDFFNAANGRYPKDHEEFMEKIIRENDIRLPVLPGGSKYQYDVENHELVVVKAGPGDK